MEDLGLGEEVSLTVVTSVIKPDVDQLPQVEMLFGDAQEDGGCFFFGPTGLQVIGTPSYELWVHVGHWLSGVSNKIQFWIGDWVNYGQGHFQERVDQAVDATEWQEETVLQAARVAAAVPSSNRDPELSYSHHRAVYAQPVAQQKVLLDQAKTEKWTAEQLRARVAEQGRSDTRCWLVVRCTDAADRDALADAMRAAGREVKLT